VFASDPAKHHRREDSLLGWSLREYLEDPEHNPEKIGIFPMLKGGFQGMKAA